MKIHIKNGRVIDPASGRDGSADVFIAEGEIVAVGTAPEAFHAYRTLDAAGLVVCPGLIDLSARLREPGYEYRATLESEMAAAVAGGVTSLACPPDTDPPLDEPGLVEMLKHRARNLNLAHVYPRGALTVGLKGAVLTEMGELADAGCIAFSQSNTNIENTQVLLRALQYAATFGHAVWLQPTDYHLAHGGVAHEGEVSTRLGLTGIPVLAETVAISTLLQLVRATGARLHLPRISSAAGLELVARAKQDGLPVTCDISINHLHLCDNDIGYFNANCRLDPPLRSASDRDALSRGLASGVVDALCSDHTPVDDDAKQLPFGEAESGATGLELLLPLTLAWARRARIPLATALARVSSDAARVMGMNAGTLAPGAAADLCIFDPEEAFRVTRESLKSQGKNTPFLGLEVVGRTRYTLVSGQFVFERGSRRESAPATRQ
ncbi:MAG: dihydroorotase [Rhodocyclaceae bacterium]|nr:dihydroorotase [Rhodocyclaceae bacterium]